MTEFATRMSIQGAKFSLGTIVMTHAVNVWVEADDPAYRVGVLISCLDRHIRGDWGTVCDEDKASNEEALQVGNRLLSQYDIGADEPLWIITEADRSVTTALWPSDY